MLCIALPLRAQVLSAPDSILKARGDSLARVDSVAGALPQTEVPFLTEVGMSHRWSRDSLFSVGALTLADFLDRVPGLSTLRARFYQAPQVGSYNGDVARVRLFLDGVELEALDPRSGGITDLSLFPVAALEELVIERGANELRLLMRSWRGPQLVTAQTRADVYTGDNRTNSFRGYLARRARNGFAFQAMLQRRSIDDRQVGGDGDGTTIFTRVGIVKPKWSVDATLLQVSSLLQPLQIFPSPSFQLVGRAIPEYQQSQRDAYVRFAMGDVARGPWVQLIAASRRNIEDSPFRGVDVARRFAADSSDTTTTSMQYVATVGWSSPRLRASLTERLRMVGGRTLHQPSARAGVDLGRLAATAYVERNPFREITTGDLFLRLQATPWLAASGAFAYGTTGTLDVALDTSGTLQQVPLPVARSARAELAVRVRGIWLQGGLIARDSAILQAPGLFNRDTPLVAEGRAIGTTFQVIGPLVRGFSLHVNGVRWTEPGLYRPQTEARSELWWRYHWRGATGNGGFRFLLAGTAEYRTQTFMPAFNDNDDVVANPTFPVTPLGLRAEFNIKDATLSVQVRNLLNQRYSTVPGLLMPGTLTIYGVRWSFWN